MPIGSSKLGVLGAGLVPGGSVTFNTSGNWSVPPGVKKVSITGKGATGNPGNAGNPGNPGNPGTGGGGGGGGAVYRNPLLSTNVMLGGAGGAGGPGGGTGGTAGNRGNNPPANDGGAGNSGNSGSGGSGGSAGNPGNTGQTSSGLGNNFAGGAGGNAGNAGNAGTAGTGGTGGGGGGKRCFAVQQQQGNTPILSNVGSGGNGGGAGLNYNADILENGTYPSPFSPSPSGYPSPPGNFPNWVGVVGPFNNVNTVGPAPTPACGRKLRQFEFATPPFTPTPNMAGFALGGGGGAGDINSGSNHNAGSGPPANFVDIVTSWPNVAPCNVSRINSDIYPAFNNYPGPCSGAYGPNFLASMWALPKRGVGGTPGGGLGGFGGVLAGGIFRTVGPPVQNVARPAYCGAGISASQSGGSGNNARAGGGGGGGGSGGIVQGAFRIAGGGGGGGRGNAGNAGGTGGAGGTGAAATPQTFNCVSVTPGATVPITVGSPGGQIVISWNPQ